MKKISDILEKILKIVCSFLIGVMTLVIVLQVISRFAGSPFTWSEEMGRYLFVWVTFYGVALAIKTDSHTALTFVLDKVSDGVRPYLRILNKVFIAIIGIVLCIGGAKLISIASVQQSSALQIPMSLVYSCIPISGALIVFFCLEKIIILLKKDEEKINNTIRE